VSTADLRVNAAQFHGAIHVRAGPVEHFLTTARSTAHTVVVDPPRSGISREAMNAVARLGAPRVIYVSCDPATMARDARRLIDRGYALRSLRALDLFPNTPHVEAVGVFDG
jgi:23S rRNA (uracil1939-C5)-methyltransferase